MTFKSHIILPNTKNSRFKTVNIVTSTVGYQKEEISTRREDTNCETVQDSGGIVKGLPTICVPGYGGGGGPYSAKAVNFDGVTSLSMASLVNTDTPYLSFSVWVKTTRVGGDLVPQSTVWTANPQWGDNYLNIEFPNGQPPPVNAPITLAGDHVDYTFTTVPNVPASPDVGDGQWHNILSCLKVDSGDGALYIDDILVATATRGGGVVAELNGLPFWVGDDGFGNSYLGDMADLWLAPINLLDNTNTAISVANRRKFISASKKPVSPFGFPSAVVLCSGDKSGFSSNQGSGGPFTTFAGALTDASTSPSD